jgi:hypothetical protein
MSSFRMIVIPMVGLTLSACGTQAFNQYVERKDTITLSAGDAVASSSAVQIPTPWPRYSNDTTIAMDGERIARAVARYREGEQQPLTRTDNGEVMYGSKFDSSKATSQGSAAGSAAPGAAAPAPGPQGY